MSPSPIRISSNLDHLFPDVRHMIDMPAEARIRHVQTDFWIAYEGAANALKMLHDILGQPRNARMESRLLVGRSLNGKSTILKEFKEAHPATVDESGRVTDPVVLMQWPDKPDERSFWSAFLIAMSIPHRAAADPRQLKQQAIEAFIANRSRMLLIDEIHNILLGHALAQRQCLGLLKNLHNDLRVGIVVAGTADALRALRTDIQVATRFKAFPLHPWKLNRAYRELLGTLEANIPLAKPSNLSHPDNALRILENSERTIGGTVDYVRALAKIAIEEGRDRIEPDIFERARLSSVLAWTAKEEKFDI
ncbi:MAG: TniB family NTP-binding protein [Acetobacteraceae bacterium]